MVALEKCIHDFIPGEQNPIFLGMYDCGGLRHTNYGPYNASLDEDTVRHSLFTILKEKLKVNALPEKVGNLRETLDWFDESIMSEIRAQGPKDNDMGFIYEFSSKMDMAMKGKLSKDDVSDLDKRATDAFIARDHTYEIIPHELFPSMGALCSGLGEGEVWEWGHLLCLFEKDPLSKLELFDDPSTVNIGPGKIKYHYTLSILDPNKNDQKGDYKVPIIMSLGIEQIVGEDYQGEIFLGLFSKKPDQISHENFGIYKKQIQFAQVRNDFFNHVKEKFGFVGFPRYKGTVIEFFPTITSDIAKLRQEKEKS